MTFVVWIKVATDIFPIYALFLFRSFIISAPEEISYENSI